MDLVEVWKWWCISRLSKTILQVWSVLTARKTGKYTPYSAQEGSKSDRHNNSTSTELFMIIVIGLVITDSKAWVCEIILQRIAQEILTMFRALHDPHTSVKYSLTEHMYKNINPILGSRAYEFWLIVRYRLESSKMTSALEKTHWFYFQLIMFTMLMKGTQFQSWESLWQNVNQVSYIISAMMWMCLFLRIHVLETWYPVWWC